MKVTKAGYLEQWSIPKLAQRANRSDYVYSGHVAPTDPTQHVFRASGWVERARFDVTEGAHESSVSHASAEMWARPRGRSALERVGLFRYVNTRLMHIVDDSNGAITAETVSLARKIVAMLGSDGSLFPYVNRDESNGISIEWVAGRDRIEVGVESGEDFYLIVASDGAVQVSSECGNLIESLSDLKVAGQFLADMTKRVSAKNPEWRSIFLKS